MKALRHIVLLLLLVLGISSCGVSKIKDISLSSVDIAYVVPTSARSLDAKLLLGIDNPSIDFAVQEVHGTIRYQEKPLAHFRTGGVELKGKTDQVYELPCTVTLDEGASLLDLLVIASRRSLEGLKADIDIQAALKKNGVLRAPWSFKDLDVDSFRQK